MSFSADVVYSLNFGEHKWKSFVVELRRVDRPVDEATSFIEFLRSNAYVHERLEQQTVSESRKSSCCLYFVADRRCRLLSELDQLRPGIPLGIRLNLDPPVPFVADVELLSQHVGIFFVVHDQGFERVHQRKAFELHGEQLLLQFVLSTDEPGIFFDQLRKCSPSVREAFERGTDIYLSD